jgi:D-ribose pyranose/furanose isomerase RbsD
MGAYSEKIFRLSDAASFQTVGDGAVILLADSGQLFSCNDTTDAFLKKLDGKRSFVDVVSLMAQEYKVEREILAADMEEIARDLETEGIITCG